MPKFEPKPSMRRTGMTKAKDAGVHPVRVVAATAAEPSAKTAVNPLKGSAVGVKDSTVPVKPTGRVSVNEGRSQFQVRLPDDLLTDLGVHAVKSGLSRRDITEAALRDYLARNAM